VTGAWDIMHLRQILRLSDIFNPGLESEFESVGAYGEIIVGVGTGTRLAFTVLFYAFSGDKLLAVVVAS